MENVTKKEFRLFKQKMTLALMWAVASISFVFCDVVSLMDTKFIQALYHGGVVDELIITPMFLLLWSVILMPSFIMILLSGILPYKPNRILNVIFGFFFAAIQASSFLMGGETLPHYYFFSAVQITIWLAIAIFAIRWKKNI